MHWVPLAMSSDNEWPDIMSKFLGNKLIDSNMKKFPLHLFTRCKRDSVYIHYSTMNTAIVLAHRYDNMLFVILFQYSNRLHRLISCAPIFKVILVVLILLWWQEIANTGRWRPSVYQGLLHIDAKRTRKRCQNQTRFDQFQFDNKDQRNIRFRIRFTSTWISLGGLFTLSGI